MIPSCWYPRLRKQEQNQVDILKFFGRATITPQSPANEPKPENQQQQQHASELLKLLQPNKAAEDQGVKQQQQMPQPPQPPNNHYSQPPPPMMFGGHPPPPPPPPSQPYHYQHHHPYPMEDMAAAAAHVNEYPMMYPQHQSSPMRPPPPPTHPPPPPPTSSAVDGELSKSLFPGSSLHPAAAASPQKTASLLQALQGGGTNGPVPVSSTSSPRNSPYLLGNRPWPSTAGASGNYSSPLSNAPPLTSQQVMDLTQTELDRRMQEGQATLSKPEFVQQFLNMVKVNITYKRERERCISLKVYIFYRMIHPS